ncbi:MAG: glycine oxidase ThiO [Acetobacteraceae bacterium]|nr:glycine oxidase ThiO [Acetobacteraceae bacterium]
MIGAGAIGLAIGWRLAQAGCAVDLYDRAQAGRGASWASAGMLAAGIEAEPGEEKLYRLNHHSQSLWPSFAAELEEAGGTNVGLRQEGTIWAALTRDDVAQLRFHQEFQAALGVRLEWLNGAQVREHEPHLHRNVSAALFSPDDHQVDNRRLVQALTAAVHRAGGSIHEEAPVTEILVRKGRAIGVRAGSQAVEADFVVVAAGAWSSGLRGLPPSARPPVRPIKGQMLAVGMDPAAPLLRHVVWAERAYLVPRLDGRLIVGATTEERGFDSRLTAGGMLSLLDAAWRVLPAIEDLEIIEAWTGFRPGSRDDAPILGGCEVEGLILATGHHRNGILLTPVTAEAISRLILTGEMPPEIQEFSLARFEAV